MSGHKARLRRLSSRFPKDVLFTTGIQPAIDWLDGVSPGELWAIFAVLTHPRTSLLQSGAGFHRDLREVLVLLLEAGNLRPARADLAAWRKDLKAIRPEGSTDLRKLRPVAGRAADRIPAAAVEWARGARELVPGIYGSGMGTWPVFAFLPFIILGLASWRAKKAEV